ncbi:hypothetical protein H257_15183 [Aphanomyces astaci]|uniref:Uncharacterized protein n=1 Tax=Aphanomyces astaci TaxID=112090 RepID=W4FNJ8_APHAT|nr:hypothetical protein H257_15183 [Aphanomyces astaci]ETV69035.1 hypothetical protein H257_15183 [Aphanomyces astaci]|eukprot:XP_009841494.1 hypothetical protein H257_15183 [Aphanomyces astaci]
MYPSWSCATMNKSLTSAATGSDSKYVIFRLLMVELATLEWFIVVAPLDVMARMTDGCSGRPNRIVWLMRNHWMVQSDRTGTNTTWPSYSSMSINVYPRSAMMDVELYICCRPSEFCRNWRHHWWFTTPSSVKITNTLMSMSSTRLGYPRKRTLLKMLTEMPSSDCVVDARLTESSNP